MEKNKTFCKDKKKKKEEKVDSDSQETFYGRFTRAVPKLLGLRDPPNLFFSKWTLVYIR